MGYVARGWSVAFSRPLAPWVLAPAAITAVVVVAGVGVTAHLVRQWLDRLVGGWGAVGWLVTWLALPLAVAGAVYVFYVGACLVATAPFGGIISEKTEEAVTGAARPPQSWGASLNEALRGIGHTLLGLALYVGLALPLVLAHFFVPIAAPLTALAGFLQTALFLAFDGFNEPLHRRGASFSLKWRFLGGHLAEALGFGSGVALLLLVPLVGVIATPVALVGGTMLYLDLAREQRLRGSVL